MLRSILDVFAVFFLFLASGKGQEILESPENQTVPLGSNTTVFCRTNGLLRWRVTLNSSLPIDVSVHSIGVLAGEEIYILGDALGTNATLEYSSTVVITGTTANNGTVLHCSAQAVFTVTSNPATVLVFASPSTQALPTPLPTPIEASPSPQPDLDLYFINDTPVVFGIGTIIAEFGYTPRPGLTVRCHLPRVDSSKDDCSSGRYERTDIPPGDYTLRVVARDPSTGERAIIRSGFRIFGDNNYCTVVLINRGVTVDGNNVTVEFAGSGIVSQFACIMDRQEYMPCQSPFSVTGLDPGPHVIDIIPTDCGRAYRATRIKFIIN